MVSKDLESVQKEADAVPAEIVAAIAAASSLTALPSATTSQLYGGTGAAGTAGAISLDRSLSIAASTLSAQMPQGTQSVTDVGQTIAVGANGSTIITTTTSANMTGMIMDAGTVAGQRFTIINETAYSIIFAASGTSHVFGTPTQVTNVAQDYIWDGTNSLWRQVA